MIPTDLVRAVARRLDDAGVEAAAAEAGWLVCAAFGLTRAQLHTVDHLDGARAGSVLEPMVQRRLTREPLQHILGSAPFRHITVAVGAGVFIPRPETELLVDAVLPLLRSSPAPVAVDLCSGSGALALALADEAPQARVVALERPGPSVQWLESNVAGTRVEARVGDVGDPTVLADLGGVVDVVVCNPPYVPEGAHVGPEVRFDPDTAVYGGADGLSVMPAVLACAAALLRPGGLLALEHDDTQGETVPALLARTGDWATIEPCRDLSGRPRYVLAVRR